MIVAARKDVTDGYSTADVSQIVGLSESKLRYWAQVGFVAPSGRRNGKSVYAFRDLVSIKAAKELIDRGFKTQNIREALQAAKDALPAEGTSASAMARLRVAFNGRTLVVVDEGVAYEASGQRVFDFGLGELAERASEALGANPARTVESLRGKKPSAYEWFVEGLALQSQPDRVDEAAACYRQALLADPGLAAAHTNLGLLAYKKGDHVAARAAFEKALAVDPEQAEARFNLANLLLDAGESELAVSELRRVLQAAPDFADAHFNLATALERLGGRAQARTHLETYIRLCGANADDPWLAAARTRLERL